MTARTRRLALGSLLALLLAVVGSHVTLHASACYPLCVIWTDANPEWYVFLCFLC